MIKTKCEACGKGYQLPDNAAGKKAKCKACGEVMSIPAADPLGGDDGPSLDDLSALYDTGSKSAAGQSGFSDAEPAAEADLGFNPTVSFNYDTPKKSGGSLPMPLLLGVGGGALGLILIVAVVAIFVLGGGGDDSDQDDDAGNGLVFDFSSSSVPTSTNNLLDNTASGSRSGQPGGTDAAVDVFDAAIAAERTGLSEAELQVLDRYEQVLSEELGLSLREHRVFPPPSDQRGLMDWTEPYLETPLLGDQFLRYCGIEMSYPADWDARYSSGGIYNTRRASGHVISLNRSRVVFEFTKSLESDRVVDWPIVVTKRVNEGARRTDRPPSISDAKGFLVWCYPRDEGVSFGTLFGGYRFVRILLEDYKDYEDGTKFQRILYAGYVGDVQMRINLTVSEKDDIELADLERRLQSARLLPEDEVRFSVRTGPWGQWREDPAVHVPHGGDTPPINLQVFAEGGDVAGKTNAELAAEFTAPVNKPYGLVIPAGFELAAESRVAVRTLPQDDGSWLSMEVHRLSSSDRRQDTPINTEQGTILLRGHRVAMPSNVEVQEVASDAFAIHRLLYPASADSAMRLVTYVIKDGPYLITLRGMYPSAEAGKLEAYDVVAKSIAKAG